MLGEKTCKGIGNKGERCRALPLRESDFCVFHDPAHAEAVQEGRRMGGLRRRREGTLAAAYEVDGLSRLDQLNRLLDIATLDTLTLENSVPRNRVIIAAVLAGTKLLEVGEQEERLGAIEAALGPRVVKREPRGSRYGN